MQVQARKSPVKLRTLHLPITIWMIIFAASGLPKSLQIAQVTPPKLADCPTHPPPTNPCHICDLLYYLLVTRIIAG